mgnify:FL=1
MFFAVANPAHAGFLSFLGKILGDEKKDESFNSQNLPLLAANAGVGGASINFVEESSLLPVVGPMGSDADIETYKLDQITTYTVRSGDNLSKIAKMFGVDVGTIYWANSLKRGDLIKEGDVLVILPITGVQYQIKKGDTLESIAKKLKGDVGEIMSYNGIDNDSLVVGSTIIIPNAELSPVPSSSGNITRGTGGPNLSGYFIRPISGGRKSQGLHGFNGVDLANTCGTPIMASASGTVLIARASGWNGGYGRYVVIAHPNGTQTVYSHMFNVSVAVGQYVQQGWQIGTVGSTGQSTGCHVHFEIRGAKNPF